MSSFQMYPSTQMSNSTIYFILQLIIQLHLLLPTNGKFNVFWDYVNFEPSQVSSIKSQHSNVIVALSLGGDRVNGGSCYFSLSLVDSVMSSYIKAWMGLILTMRIFLQIQRYILLGIDLALEKMKDLYGCNHANEGVSTAKTNTMHKPNQVVMVASNVVLLIILQGTLIGALMPSNLQNTS